MGFCWRRSASETLVFTHCAFPRGGFLHPNAKTLWYNANGHAVMLRINALPLLADTEEMRTVVPAEIQHGGRLCYIPLFVFGCFSILKDFSGEPCHGSFLLLMLNYSCTNPHVMDGSGLFMIRRTRIWQVNVITSILQMGRLSDGQALSWLETPQPQMKPCRTDSELCRQKEMVKTPPPSLCTANAARYPPHIVLNPYRVIEVS